MYIVAEIGQAHDGSLGNALCFVEAAALSGADAVKFQIHVASQESSRYDKFREGYFPQDATRYDYWKRMEFTLDEWKKIASCCITNQIDLVLSPFSEASVEYISHLPASYLKVGSGELTNMRLLRAIQESELPVIYSTGMAEDNEIDAALRSHKEFSTSDAYLLQCTSMYPCPLELVGLQELERLSLKYNLKVGLSDHSGDEHVAMAALARGAEMIEVHICWSKYMFGPDTKSSLTIDQLTRLCRFRDALRKLEAYPGKSAVTKRLADTKKLFSRSLFSARFIQKGTRLTYDDIIAKKPALGISQPEPDSLIGMIANEDIAPDTLLIMDYFT